MSLLHGERAWVYPQAVHGRYQRIHRWTGRALQALLFGLPWVTIGGHPAFGIDIPARRLWMAGHVFTAADGYLIVLLGLFASFLLFFVTSLYGRIWCGYACPQTVFLEEWVRPIEQLVEGDRRVRKDCDAAPTSFDKVWRRGVKWGLFAALAVVVSGSFTTFFTSAPAFWTGHAGTTAYGFAGALSVTAFLDWAWFREQFCNYLCPYARFQGALADDESQIVAYDNKRGEPRAKGKKSAELGNCIDCEKCVNACPQGIDIRDGYQLECIACGRCIDACESVMSRLDRPSLVHYATVAETEGRKPRLIRPRTLVYAALLAAVGLVVVGEIGVHQPLEAQVDRVPGPLFQVDPDGLVRNTWLVHVTNNDAGPERFHVAVTGLSGVEVTVDDVEVAPTQSAVMPLVVRLQPDATQARTIPLTVRISTDDGAVDVPATFKTAADLGS